MLMKKIYPYDDNYFKEILDSVNITYIEDLLTRINDTKECYSNKRIRLLVKVDYKSTFYFLLIIDIKYYCKKNNKMLKYICIIGRSV